MHVIPLLSTFGEPSASYPPFKIHDLQIPIRADVNRFLSAMPERYTRSPVYRLIYVMVWWCDGVTV